MGTMEGDILRLDLDEGKKIRNIKNVYCKIFGYDLGDGTSIFSLRVDSDSNPIYIDDKFMCKYVRFNNQNSPTITRVFSDDVKSKYKSTLFYLTIVFGRFLVITRDKSKFIVKKNSKLHYVDLKILHANNPQSFFIDKEFEKITDLVLPREESMVMYLTRNGCIGLIDLQGSTRGPRVFIPTSNVGISDESGSKDSKDAPKFLSLKLNHDDSLLAAISHCSSGTTMTVSLMAVQKTPGAQFPSISFANRKTVSTDNPSSIEYLPQYVNFSYSSGKSSFLLVFPRAPIRFHIFHILGTKIEAEERISLSKLSLGQNVKHYVDDGCMIGNSIYLSLHCSVLLKIGIRFN